MNESFAGRNLASNTWTVSQSGASGSERSRTERGSLEIQRSGRTAPGDDTCLVVHEVYCSKKLDNHQQHPRTALFLDNPRLYAGDCKVSPLHGQRPIKTPLENYLQEMPGLSFAVVRRYNCEKYHQSVRDKFVKQLSPYLCPSDEMGARPYYSMLQHNGPQAVPTQESMRNLSSLLTKAMRTLEDRDPKTFRGWDLDQHMKAPYVHLYHTKEAIQNLLSSDVLDDGAKQHTASLLKYLKTWFGSEYDEADALFKKGVVTLKHLPKLFPNNEIVVSIQDGHTKAFSIKSCQWMERSVQIQCSSWSFDGVFRRTEESLLVRWPDNPDTVVPITNLNAYPLRYGTPGQEEKLLARGAKFWSCRRRICISYAPPHRTLGNRIVCGPHFLSQL